MPLSPKMWIPYRAPRVITATPHDGLLQRFWREIAFTFAMVMIEAYGGSSLMAKLIITQDERPPRPTHPVFAGKCGR